MHCTKLILTATNSFFRIYTDWSQYWRPVPGIAPIEYFVWCHSSRCFGCFLGRFSRRRTRLGLCIRRIPSHWRIRKSKGFDPETIKRYTLWNQSKRNHWSEIQCCGRKHSAICRFFRGQGNHRPQSDQPSSIYWNERETFCNFCGTTRRGVARIWSMIAWFFDTDRLTRIEKTKQTYRP